MALNTPSNSQAKIGTIAALLPLQLKKILKPIWFFILDVKHYTKHGFDSMYQPPSKSFMGSGNYEAIGKEFFDHFLNHGGLMPHHSVLDVGCGSGRIGIPLTGYLIDGEYFGFDVIKTEIDWANSRISSKHPNFHFQHIDVTNNIYNKGKESADSFKFPYDDEKFDFIYLNSVFTHMRTNDLINYMNEISRVLKKGGRTFITYFLLNDHSKSAIDNDESVIKFKYFVEDFMTNDKENPEEAIAFDEKFIKDLYVDNKLRIIEPIRYGSWCRDNDYLSFQDIIIAEKF